MMVVVPPQAAEREPEKKSSQISAPSSRQLGGDGRDPAVADAEVGDE
jgi:hypothetical protein